MKTIGIFILVVIAGNVSAQNVGIGTNNPSEKLQVVGNVKADSFKYAAPRTTYYSIPGAAFRAERSMDTCLISNGSGGAYMLSYLSGKRMIAPVQLPHKTAIKSMTVYAIDWSSADDLEIVFWRKTITGPYFPDNMGTIITSGASSAVIPYTVPIDFFANNNVVDNTVYTYYITAGTTGTWAGTLREIRSIYFACTMVEPGN